MGVEGSTQILPSSPRAVIFFLMDTELISVETTDFGGEQVQSVNAKALYEFLDLRQDHYARWSEWVTKEWTEWEDYILSNAINGVSSELILSIDFAKTIAMMSKSKKGQQVRKYFINIEKAFKKVVLKPKSLEQTFKETMILLDNRIQELQEQIAIDAPKVHFAETISWSAGSILVREFAKLIYEKGIDMWEKKIYKWLRENGYVSKNNEPYQQYMAQGLFDVKENVVTTIFGSRMTKTTLITGKWQMYFFQKLSMSTKSTQNKDDIQAI